MIPRPDPADVASQVRLALAEDVGNGDLTAALVPANAVAHAEVIVRETGRPSAAAPGSTRCFVSWTRVSRSTGPPAMAKPWRRHSACARCRNGAAGAVG